MTTIDLRLQQLSVWAQQVLMRADLTVTVASADASFRRYFRLTDTSSPPRTWIVMDAPPEKEDVGPFIKVAEMLGEAGINAPRVVAQNLSAGFLLLTDLGSTTYLTELTQNSRVDKLYGDALSTLVKMQSGSERTRELPAYDGALLKREMDLFPEWFVSKHLGLGLDAPAIAELEEVFSFLIQAALEQPQVFVHRDYHSRNLMITDSIEGVPLDAQLRGSNPYGPNPGVLDFQDAVYGPITYDLVSLLRDCYVAWPVERVHQWVSGYRKLAIDAGLPVGSEAQLLRWFDLMGVQRHLKVLGIFARLWHRDGKAGYLKDIPQTLAYVRTVAPTYVELRPLVRLIETEILPLMPRVS